MSRPLMKLLPKSTLVLLKSRKLTSQWKVLRNRRVLLSLMPEASPAEAALADMDMTLADLDAQIEENPEP